MLEFKVTEEKTEQSYFTPFYKVYGKQWEKDQTHR